MPTKSTAITVYGISNCDTVKKARRWLEDNQLEYRFIDFRKDGFSKKQAETWIDKIGIAALLNKRSTTWKNLDPSDQQNLSAKHVLKLITQHPTSIKRPLIETETGESFVGFKDADFTQKFR